MRTIGMAALACLLAGCAGAPVPHVWRRVDGAPFTDAQFEVDRVFCRGETMKASMADTAQGPYIGQGEAVASVFRGCMAGKGYLLVPAAKP